MRRYEAIVIGCSLGGFGALKTLLGALDSHLPQAVIVCSHCGDENAGMLVELLARHSALGVSEANERQPVTGAAVHVAPAGYHLLVEPSRHFALSADPAVGFSRPSIDVLFESAADTWREALIGVVLTGANADGALGLARIRRRGGLAIVQQPRDARAPQMPQAALDLAGADHVAALAELAPLLNHLCLA